MRSTTQLTRWLGGCLAATSWIAFSGINIAVSAPGTDQPLAKPLLRIEVEHHAAGVLRITTDAEQRYAATVALDKTIRVWDLPGLKLQRVLRPPIGPGNEGTLYAVAMSPDAQTIATGGVSGSLYLFKTESGKVIRRTSGIPGAIIHLTFSPDGQWLVATLGGRQGIRVFETTSYRLVGEDRDYGAPSHYAEIDPAGQLATVSDDGYVRLYRLLKTSGTPLKLLVKSAALGAQPRSVSFAPDGQRLAIGFGDRPRVDILRVQDLSVVETLDTKPLELNQVLHSVAWSSNGRMVYAAGNYQERGKTGHARGVALIRKWILDKHDAGEDLPAGEEAIEHLLPVKDGGVLFATHDPALGLLDGAGVRQQFLASPIADFRGMGEAFQVSNKGTVVQFAYHRGESIGLFALERRQLAVRRDIDDDLTPPETGGGTFGMLGELFGQSNAPRVTDWRDNSAPQLDGRPLTLLPGEISRSVAVTPDRNSVLLGTESKLRLYGRDGAPRWQVTVPGPAWNVNIAGNGKLAVAAIGDGTIRWYRLSDGRELLALFPHQDRARWILWTPKGYFDASGSARDLIGWHQNQNLEQEALFFPADRFFEQYYRPDLVAETLTNVATDQELLVQRQETERVDMQVGPKPLPKVTILSPKTDAVVEREELEVIVQADDQGGGVDEIRLFHNGKRVEEGSRGVSTVADTATQHFQTRTFRLRLVGGTNRLRAVALSQERVEGEAAERQVVFKTAPALSAVAGATSTLHVVLIGINEYQNRDLNLNYASSDAKGFEEFFGTSSKQQGLFKDSKRYRLYDTAATKTAILGTLKGLAQSAPGDVVIIFMAGHGVAVGADWYFVPHELGNPSDKSALESKGVSFARDVKELLLKIGAKKVLLLMDTCQSGAALAPFAGRGLAERTALAQLTRATGTHLVAASTKDQFASEVGELHHGVFTYTMLEALNGEADGSPRDGVVTVREVLSYVEGRLPIVSEKYKTRPQYPVAESHGQDFPLALVR